MIRYWWVNHNQTFEQEIAGGYLWSPKKEANGARSQFYENMRAASPGDFVFSFADTRIAFLGRVSDFALSAPKPLEFGSAGSNWANEGWLLPLTWQPLHNPVRPKNIIQQLQKLLPEKYSPINTATGNGNQKAYLAEIDRAVFDLILRENGPESPRFDQEEESSFRAIVERLDVEAEKSIQDSALSTTEKAQLVKARRGQGLFRANVGTIEKACRLTGVTNRRLLIASHMKPWRSCTSAAERLDGNNGLLLTPNADLLFDRGLISFVENGQLLVSPRLSPNDRSLLGLGKGELGATAFLPKQLAYLRYHRETIFLA